MPINLDRTEYDKLGITETFDGDIEALRRNLAKKFHPDTGKQPDAARMKAINNACDILGDRAKRQAYDEALRHARQQRSARPTHEAKRASQARNTSSSPPRKPPQQPPKSSTTTRHQPPSLATRLWFVPTFIPFAGPAVSWTYAAIAAASLRYARWALLYAALLTFVIVEAAASSGSRQHSSPASEVIAIVLIVWWLIGPVVQGLRRRREVIDAMRQHRDG